MIWWICMHNMQCRLCVDGVLGTMVHDDDDELELATCIFLPRVHWHGTRWWWQRQLCTYFVKKDSTDRRWCWRWWGEFIVFQIVFFVVLFSFSFLSFLAKHANAIDIILIATISNNKDLIQYYKMFSVFILSCWVATFFAVYTDQTDVHISSSNNM